MRPERRSEPFTHAQQNETSLVHHVAIKESPWNEQAGVPACPGTTTQQEAPTVSLQQAGFPLHLAPTGGHVFHTKGRDMLAISDKATQLTSVCDSTLDRHSASTDGLVFHTEGGDRDVLSHSAFTDRHVLYTNPDRPLHATTTADVRRSLTLDDRG